MNRKKLVVAMDAQSEAIVERHFVEAYFGEHYCLLVGILVEGEPEPAQAVPNTLALREAWQNTPSPAKVQWHRDRVLGPCELFQELKYADALLMRHSLLQRMLSQQPCLTESLSYGPVILLPDSTAAIHQVVLIFDGSQAALMAIKQFVSLFPNLCQQSQATAILPCEGSNITGDAGQERLLIEYLRFHFADLGIHKVCETDEHMIPSVVDLSQPMVIIGSGSHLNYLLDQTPASNLTQVLHWAQ